MFCHDNPSHKYSAFKPECRYATDQGTLPIVVGLDKTWEEKGKKVISVSHPGAGLDKRQCSIHITFRPRGVQPKIAVIFCGTGKRISQADRDYMQMEFMCFGRRINGQTVVYR